MKRILEYIPNGRGDVQSRIGISTEKLKTPLLHFKRAADLAWSSPHHRPCFLAIQEICMQRESPHDETITSASIYSPFLDQFMASDSARPSFPFWQSASDAPHLENLACNVPRTDMLQVAFEKPTDLITGTKPSLLIDPEGRCA